LTVLILSIFSSLFHMTLMVLRAYRTTRRRTNSWSVKSWTG